MNAKKFLKTLGIAALVAAVTPYRIEKDEEKDEITCQALLWKLTNRPHPDYEDKRETNVTIAFHPPVLDCDCCCDDYDFCYEDDDCCDATPVVEEPCTCGCCCEETAPVEETPAAEESPAE